MPILNSLKQLFSNFMLMWKLIVYYLICALILVLLYLFAVRPVVAPLVEKILETGILDSAWRVVTHFISMNQDLAVSVTVLNDSVRAASGVFLQYAGSFTLAYVLLALLYIVGKFLLLLKEIPLVELVRERMTTRQKGFFTGLFIQNLGRSCIYSLSTILFTLPFDVVLGILTFFIAKFCVLQLGIFGIFVAVILLVILIAAKSSLFALCLPVVNETKKPFKGVLDGVALSCKHFAKIFLYTIPFMLLVIFAVTAFTFFTFGAAIFFIIPTAVVLSVIFREVLFFSANRRNFYLDSDTIVKGRLENDLPDLEEKNEDKQDPLI